MKLPTLEQGVTWIIQGFWMTAGFKLCLFALTFLPAKFG